MDTELIPNTVVYAVIWEDRHTDTDVTLFVDPDQAIEWAKQTARDSHRGGDLDEKLTEPMSRAGWLYYCCYSTESDCLWVLPCTVR